MAINLLKGGYMNIGIVGAGIVAMAHIKALQQITDVENVLVYTPSIVRAHDLAKQFSKVRAQEALKSVVENVTGFIIATPNNTHLSVLKETNLIKSIPVLCEKPLVSSLKDANEFLKLTHPLSIVGFNYRFNKVVPLILMESKKRNLGDILHIDLSLNRNSALTKKTLSWRDEASQNKSGGAFGDLGSHLLDLVAYMTRSKIEKNSIHIKTEIKIPERAGIRLTEDDHSTADGITTSNVSFKIQASKSAKEPDLGFHVHLVFHKSVIYYSSKFPARISIASTSQENVEGISVDQQKLIEDPSLEVPYWSDSFYLQNKAWIQQIATGKFDEMLANIEAGVEVQKLISV